MKKIVTILFCCLLLVGCQSRREEEPSVDQVLAENNYIIVDVRTESEFAKEHVKGALNIPYDEIDEHISLDKDKIILVYCLSGNRSKNAYDTLKELGYKVIDLGSYNDIDLEKE